VEMPDERTSEAAYGASQITETGAPSDDGETTQQDPRIVRKKRE
jgi:hypothetical protein